MDPTIGIPCTSSQYPQLMSFITSALRAKGVANMHAEITDSSDKPISVTMLCDVPYHVTFPGDVELVVQQPAKVDGRYRSANQADTLLLIF